MSGAAVAVRKRGADPVARETVLAWLGEVMDPEVPVVSIVDLGILRDAAWQEASDGSAELLVTVTPTYSGCPATEAIAQAIRDTLHAHGVGRVRILTQLYPAWTTDWLSERGREALRRYGIAPPMEQAPRADGAAVVDTQALSRRPAEVPCPLCGARRTRLLSQFGSTACKALYQCSECREPFDYFKPH